MEFSVKQLAPLLSAFVGKYYRYCALAVFGVIVLLGWLLVLQPQYQVIVDSGIINYESSSGRLAERQNHLNRLQLMEQRFDDLDAERLRQLDVLLPAEADAPALIASMERFATETDTALLGVDVTVIDQTEETTKNQKNVETVAEFVPLLDLAGIQPVTVAVTLDVGDGLSYGELQVLLEQLESFVPLLELRQLSYDPAATNLSLQLTTYVYDL